MTAHEGDTTRIVAYQLSLLGDPPKPGKAWRRSFWQLTWAGIALDVSDDARRQAAMLTPDTHSFDAAPPITPGADVA